MSEDIYILDGHYLIYRAYHAMSNANLHDSQGRPTGAVFGLLRMILTVLDDHEPDYLICALDSEEPTFRHEFYEDYKAERPEMPDDLRAQIPIVKELLEAFEIPVAIEPGYECDDLIASMVDTWKERPDASITIVSNDKDNFQLVDDRVRILKINQGFTDIEYLDPERVEEELGVPPGQVPDFLALVGDKIDNVPGVEGVGPTYATRLLNGYGSVEEILDDPEGISEVVSDRLTNNILDTEDQLADSKHLVVLKEDAPITFELEDARFHGFPYEELVEFCSEYDFNSIRSDLEERMEENAGWDEIRVEVTRESLESVDPGSDFFDTDVMTGYVTTDIPDEKPMAADQFDLVLFNGEQSRIISISCDHETTDPDQFGSLIATLSSGKYVTHNQKLQQLLGFRLGVQPPSEDQYVDLQLVSYLVDADEDHVLNEIIRREHGATVPEMPDDEEQYDEWLARRACLMDRVHEDMEETLEDREQLEVLDILERPLTKILARMETNGIEVTSGDLKEMAHELQGKLKRLKGEAFAEIVDLYEMNEMDDVRELFELVGGAFNLNSPTQLRKILFDVLDLPVTERTGTGKPSTAQSNIEELSGKHPFVDVLLKYRQTKKDIDSRADGDNGALDELEEDALELVLDEFDLNDPEALETLFDIVGGGFSLDSPKQLRTIFFEKLKLPVLGKTDGGDPSTDVDVLEELQGEHPLIDLILKYRKYKKIESTYLEPIVEAVNSRTGRLHTEFNQTIAATGRLSSSRPNLQNIPTRDEFGRRVREAFVASEDHYSLVAADYSQIELRLLAHISEDEKLIEAFEEGKDIHSTTAADLFEKSVDDVEESDRRVAKVVNYGITYGLSAYGLSNDLDISQPEAQDYIDRYFERYPGVEAYIDRTVKRAKKQGYVETLWGRRRYIEDLNSGNFHQQQFAERAAVNAPIQGTAADLMKRAMIELDPALDEFAANSLLQVHDELVLEVAGDQVDELIEVLESRMTGVIDLAVPITVSVKSGDNWAEVSK